MKTHNLMFISILFLFFSLSSGCATYTTPAGGVDIPAITDSDIGELLSAEPAAAFPARIAVARVQASGYISRTNQGYGQGQYCLVTTRDIEQDDDFERITRLPMAASVAPLNRLLLSSQLDSLKELRIAAARLKTDLLMLYTVDTSFNVDSTPLGPISTITLGLLPNKEAHVRSTTSGALIDVRTGYVYGVAEATAVEKQRASVWSTQDAIDESRLKSEKASFQSFLQEFEKLWKTTVEQHANKTS